MYEPPDLYRLDDLLTDEQKDLRQRVRAWVDERWLPVVARHYRDGTFPFELIPEMADLHAFGCDVRGYGRPGLDAVSYGLIMQELERGDSGLRTVASVQGALCMQAILRFGTEEQRERWLPALGRGEKLGCFALSEPNAGSNPAQMETTAKTTPEGYLLHGTKMWIGNGSVADVAVVWARLDGGEVRGFLAHKGFAATDLDNKLSLRAAVTSRLDFVGYPAELLPGSKGLKSPFQCLNQARYGIAWGALGAASACYDEARRYTRQRQQFGRPLAANQLVQQKLADMLADLTKAQLVAFRLAHLKDAGTLQPAQISLAKRENVETAVRAARTARDLLGGAGILDDRQCLRHMANLESVRTYEGTHDVHTLVLGREITGISAF